MKKFLALLVVICICFTVSASKIYDKALDIYSSVKDFVTEEIDFKLFDNKPLYESYKADLWSFDVQAQVLSAFSDGLDAVLAQSKYEKSMEDCYYNFDKVKGQFLEDYAFELAKFTKDPYKNFMRFKPGFTLGILNTKYKDFEVEGYFQIALNTLIVIGYGTDLVGYDGMYGYGLSASYKEKLDVKAGFHHFSGHYSDEVMDSLLTKKDKLDRTYGQRMGYDKDDIKAGDIFKLAEYVRQDSLIVGVSYRPNEHIRVYGEADLLVEKMDTLRPWILIPNFVDCSWSDDDMLGRIGESEGIFDNGLERRIYEYSDDYKGSIYNCGIEYYYNLKKYGNLSVALNLRFNQEGQTMYQFDAYDPSNSWNIDKTIMATLQIKDSPFALQLMYHDGMIPQLNYFHYRDKFLAAGFTVSF